MFPKIGVPQNGWFIMENPIKMDDLGVPPFSETPYMSEIYRCKTISILQNHGGLLHFLCIPGGIAHFLRRKKKHGQRMSFWGSDVSDVSDRDLSSSCLAKMLTLWHAERPFKCYQPWHTVDGRNAAAVDIMVDTPPKINIEPENDGLEDDLPFPGVYSQVPC